MVGQERPEWRLFHYGSGKIFSHISLAAKVPSRCVRGRPQVRAEEAPCKEEGTLLALGHDTVAMATTQPGEVIAHHSQEESHHALNYCSVCFIVNFGHNKDFQHLRLSNMMQILNPTELSACSEWIQIPPLPTSIPCHSLRRKE